MIKEADMSKKVFIISVGLLFLGTGGLLVIDSSLTAI
jgi:hypothetical protein